MADLFLFRSPVGHIFILISHMTHTYINFLVCSTDLIHILVLISYLYVDLKVPIGTTDV